MNSKIILVAVVIAIISAFFIFDLGQYFSLEYLKAQKDALSGYYQQNPIVVATAFFLIYVLAATFPLPAAAVILTLTGGAVFGFWVGLVLVSFASSIGATFAFLLTRFLFTDLVQERFGDRLKPINDGFEKEGALYVFGLRLVPIFSFVAVNCLLALTKLKAWTFYWASQIGMLAGTAVYVFAGTQLAEIESLGDIADPKLLVAFALLGVFPILAKKGLEWLRNRRSAEA